MKPMRVDAGPLIRAICEQLEVIPIALWLGHEQVGTTAIYLHA